MDCKARLVLQRLDLALGPTAGVGWREIDGYAFQIRETSSGTVFSMLITAVYSTRCKIF